MQTLKLGKQPEKQELGSDDDGESYRISSESNRDRAGSSKRDKCTDEQDKDEGKSQDLSSSEHKEIKKLYDDVR